MLYRIPIIGLLLISMMLSACTTDNALQDDDAPAVISTPLDSVPRLRESYTWSNIFTDSAISVDYPSGWFIEAIGDQLLISSIDTEDLESDSSAIIINILPAEGDMLLEGADTTPESLLELSFLDSLGEIEEIQTSTINDNPSAYTSGEFEGNSSTIYTIQVDEAFFVVVIAVKAQAFTDIEQALVVAIVESVRYETGILESVGE